MSDMTENGSEEAIINSEASKLTNIAAKHAEYKVATFCVTDCWSALKPEIARIRTSAAEEAAREERERLSELSGDWLEKSLTDDNKLVGDSDQLRRYLRDPSNILTPESASELPDIRLGNPGRDWPEDFAGENGNYDCICIECGNHLTGHKRRVACKACATEPKTCETCDHQYDGTCEDGRRPCARWAPKDSPGAGCCGQGGETAVDKLIDAVRGAVERSRPYVDESGVIEISLGDFCALRNALDRIAGKGGSK